MQLMSVSASDMHSRTVEPPLMDPPRCRQTL